MGLGAKKGIQAMSKGAGGQKKEFGKVGGSLPSHPQNLNLE